MVTVKENRVGETHWEIHLDFVVSGREPEAALCNPNYRAGHTIQVDWLFPPRLQRRSGFRTISKQALSGGGSVNELLECMSSNFGGVRPAPSFELDCLWLTNATRPEAQRDIGS